MRVLPPQPIYGKSNLVRMSKEWIVLYKTHNNGDLSILCVKNVANIELARNKAKNELAIAYTDYEIVEIVEVDYNDPVSNVKYFLDLLNKGKKVDMGFKLLYSR